MLFDECERNHEGPAADAEPRFTFLNRSSRKDVAQIRDVLTDWFSRYPAEHQAELRKRLRDTHSAVNHPSAMFELWLHQLLSRLGCELTVHSNVGSNTAKAPDFRAEPPDDGPFYLEAVLCPGKSHSEQGADACLNKVYDELNKLHSPNFWIQMIATNWRPQDTPSVKRWRGCLEGWLATLDPDELAERYRSGGSNAMPRKTFEHEGQEIELSVIPKSPEARGRKGERSLGVYPIRSIACQSEDAIKQVIKNKVGRYGELCRPYVVAANVLDHFVILFQDKTPMEDALSRGVFTANRSGVSAVLAVRNLDPWTFASAEVCLYHNPWAERPYASILTRLPQAVWSGEQWEYSPGEKLSTILGLPPGWPWE